MEETQKASSLGNNRQSTDVSQVGWFINTTDKIKLSEDFAALTARRKQRAFGRGKKLISKPHSDFILSAIRLYLLCRFEIKMQEKIVS